MSEAIEAVAAEAETTANEKAEVNTEEKTTEATTLLKGDGEGQGGEEEGKVLAPADWPEDWRSRLVGDDEKALKRLERYGSPKDVAKALFAAQQKISSGELKAGKPENATPEQLAEWRKANGIPDAPDKYDTTLPDGLVIGDEDKPLVDIVLKAAHEADASPAVVKNVLAAYYKTQDEQAALQADADAEQKEQTVSDLRAEWGPDYKRNLNMVEGYLGSLPDGVGGLIAGSRGPDGRPLGSNANVARWLAAQAREANPLASVMPSTGDAAKGADEEINNLKSLMGNRNSEYWKGPKADELQARYRELISAKEKIKARG